MGPLISQSRLIAKDSIMSGAAILTMSDAVKTYLKRSSLISSQSRR